MYLSSDDLLSGLGWLSLWLVVAGAIVALLIWRSRRSGSTTLALDVTNTISLFYVCVIGLSAVFNGFQTLGRTSVFLSDDVSSQLDGLENFLRTSACPDDFSPEAKLCGVEVGPVPFGIRMLIYVGLLLSITASAAVAWAIYIATKRAIARDPFHASVARTFGVMAIVMMVTAVLGNLLQQVGMTLAAQSLDWAPDAPPISFQLSIELWPFALAVGLFAMAAIFKYGGQLQAEREQLKRETEGLV